MSLEGGSRRVSRAGGLVVRPQPISDKSYVESVVSFLHDVVPQVQAVTGSQRTEDKERVLWMRFEKPDIDDECCPKENDCGTASPILLVLGYTNGFQMWAIPSIGDAHEVLSLRQGPVRLVKVLQTPRSQGRKDEFAASRPLFAICDAASPSLPFSTVNLWSLTTGEQVHSIGFKTEVYDVLSNRRLMVVALQEKVAAFDACTMSSLFCIMSCFPARSPNLNPLALGERWLAYADCKLVPNHQSCGGMSGDNAQSYAATVINAAKTLTRGLTMFGETVGRWTSSNPHELPSGDHTTHKGKVVMPGVVTIVDIPRIGTGEFCVQEDDHEGNGIIAHFPAHSGQPVSALAFDPSGFLLVTTDVLGHNFHVFHIMAHPVCTSLGAVHHLYTLHRGDTTATVYNISFSFDSRWIAVSTLRGTTHLFGINPYGGSVTVRTHLTSRVVNRSSRFHTSAGLDDMEIHTAITSGRSSPGSVQNNSPNGSPHSNNPLTRDNLSVPGAGNNCLMNPRLPPLPHPYVMYPLAQIRTPTGARCSGTCCGGSSSGISKCNGKVSADSLGVVALFASSRGWLGGSANSTRSEPPRQPVVDPLFILDLHGNLTEYTVEPQGIKNASHSNDTPLELSATSRAQWSLARSPTWLENKGPLQAIHPFLEWRALHKPDIKKEERSSSTIEEAKSMWSKAENKDTDDEWLTNIEMETHAGPHRRLWMGPQFSFKTFQPPGSSSPSSSSLSLNDPKCPSGATITPHREGHPLDFYTEELDLQSLRLQPVKSDPMPTPGGEDKNSRPTHGSPNSGTYPLIVDNGPGSFSEPWPCMVNGSAEPDKEGQLVETLLDAMNDNATMPVKTDKKRSLFTNLNGDQLEFHSDSPGGSVNAFASYNSSDNSPIFPPNGSPEWS